MATGRKLKIGDRVPYTGEKRLHAEGAPPPGWYVLQAKPGQQYKARQWLETNGVECWWPVKTVWRRHAFRKTERVKAIVPIASGYVFTRWPSPPKWHRLFGDEPGSTMLASVVSIGGNPRLLNEPELERMAQMPDRLEAERAEAAKQARPKTGDRARVLSGIYEGWTLEIGSIEGELAELLIPLLGRNPKIAISQLKKEKTAK